MTRNVCCNKKPRKPYRALLNEARLGNLRFCDPALLCGGLFLLFWMDAGGWLRLSLLASLCHELGHIAVYLLCMGHFPQIDVTPTGFCLHTRALHLPAAAELAVTLAGPGMNLLLALFCYCRLQDRATVSLLGFLWANLLVGGFNLLPVPPLDGAAAVYLLWCLLRGDKK